MTTTINQQYNGVGGDVASLLTTALSTVNSSTATLGAGAVFTGTAEDITKYAEIRVSVYSDVASATDGLQIQQSSDGTNWDASDSYTIPAATNKTFGVGAAQRYMRVVYTNGGTIQTAFRLSVKLNITITKPSSVRPQDTRSNENDFEEVAAYGMVFNGNTWDRCRGSTNGLWVQGAANHSGGSVGAPIRIGGRVNTAVDTTLVLGDASDLFMTTGGAAVVKPYSTPEVDWSYAAAASGIANTTTAVTVKAAAAAGVRNYITNIQLSSDALTAATEFAIRDGAAGTVLWRCKIGTAGIIGGLNVDFAVPLRGTAATLLEVVTLTASIAGAVYVNLQGYTAP